MVFTLQSLFASKGLRSVGVMTVGSLGATALSAIAMIIFSRALGPAQFGIFSVIFSLLLILSKIGDLGINIAVQRETAQSKGYTASDHKIIKTGTALKWLLLGIMAIVGVIWGPWIGVNWLNIAEYGYLVRYVFLLAGGVVFYEYTTVILQAKELFGWSVAVNFVQSALKLLSAVAVLYLGITMDFLAFIYLLIPFLGGMIGYLKLPLSYLVPSIDRKQLKLLILVSRWTGIAILSATIADNIDVILVQKFLTSYETGIWSAAVRVASLYSLVAWSLGTVLNVRVAKYHDLKHLRTYLKKANLIALATFIGISTLSLFSGLVISLTAGPLYLGSVLPLQLLSIASALMAASTPFVALFYLFDKPQYYAYAGIIQTVILVVGDYILIPSHGIVGAAWVRIVVRLVVLVFTLLYVRHAYLEKYGHNK